jgi:hypothetical protein
LTDRGTRKSEEYTTIAFEQPTALYHKVAVEGIPAADLLSMTPTSVYEQALSRSVDDEAKRVAVMESFDRKVATECQIMVASGKHGWDERNAVRLQSAEAAHEKQMASILGGDGYRSFRQELLKNPVARLDPQKLMNELLSPKPPR